MFPTCCPQSHFGMNRRIDRSGATMCFDKMNKNQHTAVPSQPSKLTNFQTGTFSDKQSTPIRSKLAMQMKAIAISEYFCLNLKFYARISFLFFSRLNSPHNSYLFDKIFYFFNSITHLTIVP